MSETIHQAAMLSEELFLLLTIQGNIPFHQEEAQKAVQDIHLVPITAHLQEADLLRLIAADLPVLNQEVHILQVLHRGHHPVPLQVLHQGGTGDNN
jgi:hypothetical protein